MFVSDCCILLDKCLWWWVLFVNNCWNVSGCRCAVGGVFLVVAVFIIGWVFMVVNMLLVCCLFGTVVYCWRNVYDFGCFIVGVFLVAVVLLVCLRLSEWCW